MKRLSTLVAGLALIGATAGPALAHHPFDADYDAKKPVKLTGTIDSVEWTNPHVHTFLNVRGANGEMTMWDIELGSPADLGTDGWTRTTLKTGESVTFDGWQAKDGTNRANAKSVTLINAKKLAAASSYDSRSAREEVATSGKK